MRISRAKPVTGWYVVALCCAALILHHGIRDFMLTVLPTLAASSSPKTTDLPPTSSPSDLEPTTISPTDVTDDANPSESKNVDDDKYDWGIKDFGAWEAGGVKAKRETTDTRISGAQFCMIKNKVNFMLNTFHRGPFPFVRSHAILVKKAKTFRSRRSVHRPRPVRDVRSRVWTLELRRWVPQRDGDALEQEPNSWTVTLEGVAISAVYWGWLPAVAAGPWIVFRLGGGGMALALSLAWAGLLALLTPLSAMSGPGAVIAVRFFTGLGQGLAYPAAYDVLEAGTPHNARALAAFIVFGGAYVGSSIGAGLGTLQSWCVAPYTFGALAVLLSGPCVFFLGAGRNRQKDLLPQVALLRQVLRTRAVAAVLGCHLTFQWVAYTLLLALTLSGAPNSDDCSKTTAWGVPTGLVLQGLVTRGLHLLLGPKVALGGPLDPLSRRRVPMLAAGMITGALLVALAIMSATGSDAEALSAVAVTCLTAGVGLTAAGYRTNLEDVAPGSLPRVVTLVNIVGILPACVAPVVAAALAQLGATGWTVTYSVCAAAILVTSTVFLFFLSTNAAPWDAPERPPAPAARGTFRKVKRVLSGVPTAAQQKEDDGLSFHSTGNKSFVSAKSGYSFYTAASQPRERTYSCYTADDDLEEDMRSIEDDGSSVACRSAIEDETDAAECKSVASSSTFKSQVTSPPPPREQRLPSILVGSQQGKDGAPPSGTNMGAPARTNVKWASTPWRWTSGDRTSAWLEAHHDVSLEAGGKPPSKAECRARNAIYGFAW